MQVPALYQTVCYGYLLAAARLWQGKHNFSMQECSSSSLAVSSYRHSVWARLLQMVVFWNVSHLLCFLLSC